jgi:hypothetical protein
LVWLEQDGDISNEDALDSSNRISKLSCQ